MHHVVSLNKYINRALKLSNERYRDSIKNSFIFLKVFACFSLPSLVLVILGHFLNLDRPLFGLHFPLEDLKERHQKQLQA